MDEKYLPAAVKYIEMNPVRPRLVADPYAWRWSSARAHTEGNDDLLVKVAPLLELVGDWKISLGSGRRGCRQDPRACADGTGSGRGHLSRLIGGQPAANRQAKESGPQEEVR